MFTRCSLDGLTNAISGGYSSFKSTVADTVEIGSEKIQQTAGKVRSLVTVDNLAQAAIATSIAFGGAIASTGGGLNTIDGIVVASVGAAISTTAWGLTSLFRGDREGFVKKMMVGGTLFALASKTMELGRLSIHQQSHDFKRMEKDLSGFKAEHEITKQELARVNEELGIVNGKLEIANDKLMTTKNELLKANIKLEEFEELNIDKDEYLKLFIDNNKCHKDLARSKATVDQLLSRSFYERLTNKAPKVVIDYDDEESPFPNRHITFGTTYVKDPSRERQATIINANHKEYAKAWKIKHKVVEDNLLIGQCKYGGSEWYKDEILDCVPYWNKVALLRNWLNEPKNGNKEEWYILVDDDMPVTNMKVDPNEAIDLLRRGKDTSLIIVRDVSLWKKGDPELSVNTGLFMVRKDEQSKQLIEKLWQKRNDLTPSGSSICRTLGTCKNQEILHEQEAFARVIEDDRSIINKVITIVKPRDNYKGKELALNVFNRWGCFIRDQDHWGTNSFAYDSADAGYPEGRWRVGDWMGQTAGVPANGWYCDDKRAGKPSGPIRNDRLEIMIEQAVKKED